MCFLGSLGSKSQVGQPSSGVYGTSAAPVASQSSGSFAHSATATTAAPYSADTSTDYSQYNQAYTQVTHTLTLQRNLILNPPLTSHKKNLPGGFLSASLPHFFLSRFSAHSSWHSWYLQTNTNPILNVYYTPLIKKKASLLDNPLNGCLHLSGKNKSRRGKQGSR